MLVIIGCGNPNRSDDGVGAIIAKRIREFLDDNPNQSIQAFDAGTDGISVMFQARGATSLIIVDACRTDADAGAVFEVPGSALENKPPHSFNLHDFRWDHALYAGRQIFKDEFPDDITVFLIECDNLDHGLELSAPVAAAADVVVDRITKRIAGYDCEQGA